MTAERESLAVVVGRNCKRIRTKIGITQDELSRYARDLGLRWKASAVGDFEAGRSAPQLATVLTLTAALQWALEDAAARQGLSGAELLKSELPGVTLADLLVGDGFIALTDAFEVTASELADVSRRGYVFTLEPSVYKRPGAAKSLRDLVDPLRPSEMNRYFGPEATRKREIQARAALREIEIEEGVTFRELTEMLQRSGLAEDRLARGIGVKPAELASASFRLWQKTFTEERDRRAGPDANQQKKGRISRELRAELQKALKDGNDQ